MYPTAKTITPAEALKHNLDNNLYTTSNFDIATQNASIIEAISQQKTAAKYTVASGIASIVEAQAGVEAVKASKSQYASNKSLINRNIAATQTLMMENFQDTMAQLDAVTAAKNVDINSQAVRAMKERGLMDMGKDFADMQTQGEFQKSALDLQYTMQKMQAEQARNKVMLKSFNSMLSAAEYLL